MPHSTLPDNLKKGLSSGLPLHFFAALTNRGINKIYYNGQKAVWMHDQQERNQTHRLIACGALVAVTNNFWSL